MIAVIVCSICFAVVIVASMLTGLVVHKRELASEAAFADEVDPVWAEKKRVLERQRDQWRAALERSPFETERLYYSNKLQATDDALLSISAERRFP